MVMGGDMKFDHVLQEKYKSGQLISEQASDLFVLCVICMYVCVCLFICLLHNNLVCFTCTERASYLSGGKMS